MPARQRPAAGRRPTTWEASRRRRARRQAVIVWATVGALVLATVAGAVAAWGTSGHAGGEATSSEPAAVLRVRPGPPGADPGRPGDGAGTRVVLTQVDAGGTVDGGTAGRPAVHVTIEGVVIS